jgi:hypothetical protein
LPPHPICPGAGRGLVISSDVPYNPFAPPPDLISIPTSALLNVQTLRPLYPRSFSPPSLLKSSTKLSNKPSPSTTAHVPLLPLTATQLLTLHLALHCPYADKHPSLPDDPWAPYVLTLPCSFHYHHPLTWLVDLAADDEIGETQRTQTTFAGLTDLLPARTRTLVLDVHKRFEDDVRVLREVLVSLCLVSHAGPPHPMPN